MDFLENSIKICQCVSMYINIIHFAMVSQFIKKKTTETFYEKISNTDKIVTVQIPVDS